MQSDSILIHIEWYCPSKTTVSHLTTGYKNNRELGRSKGGYFFVLFLAYLQNKKSGTNSPDFLFTIDLILFFLE